MRSVISSAMERRLGQGPDTHHSLSTATATAFQSRSRSQCPSGALGLMAVTAPFHAEAEDIGKAPVRRLDAKHRARRVVIDGWAEECGHPEFGRRHADPLPRP